MGHLLLTSVEIDPILLQFLLLFLSFLGFVVFLIESNHGKASPTSPRRVSIILSAREKWDYSKFIGFAEEIRGFESQLFMGESENRKSRSRNKMEQLRVCILSGIIYNSLIPFIAVYPAFLKTEQDVLFG